jgi:FKBP-type peptidyl-prolyl cis-trans isomerase FklB
MVRAMKNTTTRPFRLAATQLGFGCMLLAVTPLVGAQNVSTPAGAAAPHAVQPAAPSAPADTSTEHTSYLFGLTFAEQMHAVGITDQLDMNAIQRGVKDGLQGKKSTRADQQQIQQFVQSVIAAAAARNKAAAQEFLTRNGHDKSVKTTASGLQYKVIAAGDAKAPAIQPADEVTVNYRGKLLDGTEFDSSYARGAPASFKVNGVIPGWQEALVLMKPGAKWQLFIPPELAYDMRSPPGIPPGSMLIFDVDLVSAKPSAAPTTGPATPMPPQSHRAVPPLNPSTN